MSVAIVSILLLKFADFDVSDKAKNAFQASGYSSDRTLQIYVFFLTMQRSKKNIISSKVNKFLEIYGHWRTNPYIPEKILSLKTWLRLFSFVLLPPEDTLTICKHQ